MAEAGPVPGTAATAKAHNVKQSFMNTTNGSPPMRSIFLLALVSGLIGFAFAALVCGGDQWSVEFGQTQAGIVPARFLYGLFLGQIWSLANQLSALGLLAGCSEFTVSLLISGLIGMLLFQGLALLIYAINGRFWIAALAPLLLYCARAITYGNAVYQTGLEGSCYSMFGMLGFANTVVVIALFGLGRYRGAAFLLGLLPAWQVVQGGLMWFVAGVAWLWVRRTIRRQDMAVLGWFAGGVLTAMISLGIHLYQNPPLPKTNAAEIQRHLSFYIENWASVREKLDFSTSDIWINAGGLVVVFLYLKRAGVLLPERLKLMLTVLSAGAITALVSACLMYSPFQWLIRLFPIRLLTVLVVCYAALLLGVLTDERHERSMPLFGTLFILLLGISTYMFQTGVFPGTVESFMIIILVVGSVMVLLAMRSFPTTGPAGASLIASLRKCQLPLMVGLTCFILAKRWPTSAWREIQATEALSRTAHQQAATSEPGVLLTASDFDVPQLRTRRPVLLNVTTLDPLMYAPAFLPAMAMILKDVYGVDFFKPSPESRHLGALPPGAERTLWEARSAGEWKAIREKYHVTDVLVPAAWSLQLPVKTPITLEASSVGLGARQDGVIYYIP